MKDNRFFVYGHYTLDTDKLFYIGEGTKRRINDRSNRNRYWNFKVKKHGFTSKVFHSNLTKEDAQKIEMEFRAFRRKKPHFWKEATRPLRKEQDFFSY